MIDWHRLYYNLLLERQITNDNIISEKQHYIRA